MKNQERTKLYKMPFDFNIGMFRSWRSGLKADLIVEITKTPLRTHGNYL